jgi:hypothetical protein
LVQEAGLFLHFLSSHAGRECGLTRQQCAIRDSASNSAGTYAGLFWERSLVVEQGCSGEVRSLPHIQMVGAFQIGNAVNDKNETANNNFYFSDTASLSRGKHNLRFGSLSRFLIIRATPHSGVAS